MKKTLIALLLIITISGCFEKKDKIELIRPVNDEYFYIEKIIDREGRLITQVYNISNEQVKKISETLDGVKKLLLESNHNFEITTLPIGITFRPNLFLYTLYINEVGNITKVVAITSPSSTVDTYVVKQMEGWQMEIYKTDNKPFKYAMNWEFSLFKPKGKEYLSLLSSNLNVSEEINAPNEEDFFVAVDEMPSPIGGVKAIQGKIHYPEIAKRAGIQGRVFVKAFIDEKGSVTKAEIIKGLGGGCDDEAKNAVMETKFTPGRQRGKAVKTQVTVPILFKLDSKKRTEIEKNRATIAKEEIERVKSLNKKNKK